MATTLVTVADDRFGRKDSKYAATQERLHKIIYNNRHFGIDTQLRWTWEDIAQTGFYYNNKTLLDNKDAARNGRAYKVFVIKEALRLAEEGDFIIYSDASPEMWNLPADYYIKDQFNLRVLTELCQRNGGLLTSFVKWDTRHIPAGGKGIHTHVNFTSNLCMNTMKLGQYRNSYMHSTGFVVLQKSARTIDFMDEWLYWNCIDKCCALGKADVPDDYSYWNAEDGTKMGHRGDQSISGLLVNRDGYRCVELNHDFRGIPAYNFLNFCRTDIDYKFINPNEDILQSRRISKGDTVVNEAGVDLTVFEIWPENGIETYIVGVHRESCYKTTEQHLTLKGWIKPDDSLRSKISDTTAPSTLKQAPATELVSSEH